MTSLSPPMIFRDYNSKKDRKAAHRIWYETNWIGDKEDEAPMDIFLAGGRTLVADINGEAECLVASMPGSLRYLDQDLSFSAVTAVTTSRIARKKGLARRLTAKLIALDAAEGALVSGLGMFEQGFYNQLGFGTGGYEHMISFDPAQLHLKRKARIPDRLSEADWEMMHAALLARQRNHGACNLFPPNLTQAELRWTSNGFGLGYKDGPAGELTHFFWAAAKGETGPYNIRMLAYQTWDQFLELMALIKNLGDQVRLVRMLEPSGIQIQDLIIQPFRYRQLTRKSEYENVSQATAYWQVRICDLPGCLARTHLRGEAIRFNLRLSDPVEKHLDPSSPWPGIKGDYTVTLGPASAAESGTDPTLPTLTATVSAFTRLWLGVQPATGLAVTDNLAGPPELLQALDEIVRLPRPSLGWDF